MYLKSLEIQGFKSFPDKTLLQFGSDCTAIVGPNGSGKSNISDAISWVLGEQSTRALRGAKMEDVIFGGTAKRPAVGYAEATLVLDNSDASLRIETPEVMITRRYFRSGESEYYINKQLARLKDINELFMDTGLGREGYSNIGRAASTRFLHSNRPTAAKFLKRPQAFPNSATGKRTQSAALPIQRTTFCVSATRSPNWNFRLARCGSRRRKHRNI